MDLQALPDLRALDSGGRLLQRLALAFAQTVATQRPQVGGEAHERALHTLRGLALDLGATELQQLCERLQHEGAQPALLQRLDALLADAQAQLDQARLP